MVGGTGLEAIHRVSYQAMKCHKVSYLLECSAHKWLYLVIPFQNLSYKKWRRGAGNIRVLAVVII